jgi:hypothetical protein
MTTHENAGCVYGTQLATRNRMRCIVFWMLAVVACSHRANPPIVGTPLGESTAPGPRFPIYMIDAGVSAGGPLSPNVVSWQATHAPAPPAQVPEQPQPVQPQPVPPPPPPPPEQPAPAPGPEQEPQTGVTSPPPVNP